jgi:hypothetical protein
MTDETQSKAMSFRNPRNNKRNVQRAWDAWLAHNANALKAIDLPPALTLSFEHWVDFLQNGYLEMHPEANDGFSFEQMSREHMERLLKILGASPQFAGEPLVAWLRQRLSR